MRKPNVKMISGEATRRGRGPDAAKAAAVSQMEAKARREGYAEKLGPNLFDEPRQVSPGKWKARVQSKYHL
jgi:hypothetical protein